MSAQNGWRPGLVALDIDGTVVDWDNNLQPAVHEAVQRILAAGVPVVHHRFAGLFHGFLTIPALTATVDARRRLWAWIIDLLAGPETR